MTGAPKGYRRCPESIYRSAEPFLQGNTEPTKAKTMSRCKTADHGVILPCAAAKHIEELLSTTFPLYACESRIKLNPVK